MSRVLKIVSFAVVIFLAYMWISVLTKSCNKQKEISFPNQKEKVKESDEFSSEDFFDESDTLANTFVGDKKNDVIDYKEVDKTIENTKSDQTNKNEVVKNNVPTKIEIEPKKNTTQVVKKEVPEKINPDNSPVLNTDKNIKSVSDKKLDSNLPSKGNYVVIAGNYLVESNAQDMLRKLKKAGFNAEKVVFNLSEFHTVIVGRYNDSSSASKSVSSLKAKGFDAYLHRIK